jgi:hypothetical protein
MDNRVQVVFAPWMTWRNQSRQAGATAATVGVREFRGNPSGFLRQARQGSTFLVMSHDQHWRVRPPPQAERATPGALRGKIRIAPDFDTLPTDAGDVENEDE